MPKNNLLDNVPEQTIEWLTSTEDPVVATLTHRNLLGEQEPAALAAAWEKRNSYPPISVILDRMNEDGSWAPPQRDYKKYEGSLWQIHFLGELQARGDDPRIARAAEYAFSRQLGDGSWSCSNRQPSRSIPCLTANVGRALARMGFAEDERIVSALRYVVEGYIEQGELGCVTGASNYTLNGYCHMLAPKVLLFISEVTQSHHPAGTERLRDAAVGALRAREVFRCLPEGSREFQEAVFKLKGAELEEFRRSWMAEHGPLSYKEKPGWLRFGFPLSYNSDALESLLALSAVGETKHKEYEPAINAVADAADDQMRWMLRTSFNGKMLADVEKKGKPSRWVTMRALEALSSFESLSSARGTSP